MSVKNTSPGFLLISTFSLLALTATFFISNLNLAFEIKTAIFLTLVVSYLLLCATLYLLRKETEAGPQPEGAQSVFDDDVEGKLLALEEANEFFGASLKSADMFRLVSSRIGEIVPFSTCVLFLHDPAEDSLAIKFAAGANSQRFAELKSKVTGTLASKVFQAGGPCLDSLLFSDRTVFPDGVLQNLNSAVAVPLASDGRTFGVLVLYSDRKDGFNDDSMKLLQAVGERVAPLFLSSLSFEQSIANALTDPLTNLPNERAFFLILENQLAESLRYRDERPLTVLAIDIRDFAELNEKHGHPTGDRLLAFAAATVKKQLRQMDVLTRASGDEFLAILPTASEKIGRDVIQRIRQAFASSAFEIPGAEKIYLEMNFGAATFWRDGETAQELLQTALMKKRHDKSLDGGNVLWFPKEFVN